jgi:hypothetical protein
MSGVEHEGFAHLESISPPHFLGRAPGMVFLFESRDLFPPVSDARPAELVSRNSGKDLL